MSIGNYCKNYRLSHNATVSDIAGNIPAQTLYSFESGNSTNYKNIKPYLRLAYSKGENTKFCIELFEMLLIED